MKFEQGRPAVMNIQLIHCGEMSVLRKTLNARRER
jgi:hypothetical protein